MRRMTAALILGSLAALGGASLGFAQQPGAQQAAGAKAPPGRVAADYLADGFEIKAVVNNTFLLLQKGNRAYLCGSHDPGLSWVNWAQATRSAGCEPLTR